MASLGVFAKAVPVANVMRANAVKYWVMIAADLTERGWTCGFVSLLNFEGRNMFNVDAGCGDGKRFVVRLDQLQQRMWLTAS